MTPERIVYTDAPAFIPVPRALQHRKVEVILWPLDEEPAITKENPATWQSFFKLHSRLVDEPTPCTREELYADRLR